MPNIELEAIVLCDEANAIGRHGDQPYYIKDDLKKFRNRTMGHRLICGRRTIETFPGARGLKGRTTLVLTRQPELFDLSDEAHKTLAFGNTNDLLAYLSKVSELDQTRKNFVVGGSSVYEQLLPWTNRIYMTRIHAYAPGADRFFPKLEPSFSKVEEGEWIYDPDNRAYYRLEIWESV